MEYRLWVILFLTIEIGLADGCFDLSAVDIDPLPHPGRYQKRAYTLSVDQSLLIHSNLSGIKFKNFFAIFKFTRNALRNAKLDTDVCTD